MAGHVSRAFRVFFATAGLIALARCLSRGSRMEGEAEGESDLAFLSLRGSPSRASSPPVSLESAAPRHARAEPSAAEAGGAAVWASALLVSVCLAGAWQRSRRTVKVSRACIVYKGYRQNTEGVREPYVESVLNSGPIEPELSKEELDTFLEARCAGLAKMLPSSDEDFDDEVGELTWQWARHLLPYTDKNRHMMAGYKRRYIIWQREFFEKLRLFKPLAMRYPTVMRRFIVQGRFDLENRKLAVNSEFIYNEEQVAGFSYEDFVKETNGITFDKWEQNAVGDTIKGTVAAYAKDGAFIEIGEKNWAFMPLKDISLAPVFKAEDAVKIGEEIEAVIMEMGAESRVPGDYEAQQTVLSRSIIQRVSAWEDIKKMYFKTSEDVADVMTVNVKSLTPFGAVVQAKSGLEGFIPSGSLAEKADDPRIVGTDLEVEITSFDDEIFEKPNRRDNEYYLLFSHANVATKGLARAVEEYQLVQGTIQTISPAQLLVEVQGALCRLSKTNISAVREFDLSTAFEKGEELTCMILSRDRKSGEVVLSTRALEFKRGAMLTDRAECFERAEDTVSKYIEVAEAQKQVFSQKLQDEMSKQAPSSKPPSAFDVMGDDDDDLSF